MTARSAMTVQERLLDDVATLRESTAKLKARLDQNDRELAHRVAGDLDRVLSLKETAVAIGKSPVTLRHWLADAVLFERYHLNALVRKDVTGHWVSSPRLIARYRQVAFRALQELAR